MTLLMACYLTLQLVKVLISILLCKTQDLIRYCWLVSDCHRDSRTAAKYY